MLVQQGLIMVSGDSLSVSISTKCDAIMCDENHFVGNHQCIQCENNYFNIGINDDASGPDTICCFAGNYRKTEDDGNMIRVSLVKINQDVIIQIILPPVLQVLGLHVQN